MKAAIFLGVALAMAVAAAGCTGTGPGDALPNDTRVADGGAGETLTLFSAGTQTLLDETSANVSRAAVELGRTGLAGSAADAVLANLSGSAVFVIDAITYNAEGRVVAVEPDGFASLVGANLMGPTTPPDFYEDTYLGSYGRLAEGFTGVALGYPVADANGTAIGGVSVAMRPELLLKGPADDARNGRPLSLFAVQPDGIIVYADDLALVGRQASQPGSGIAGIASEIVGRQSGASSHRPANSGADRVVAWETVGLHGTEWRVVVAQR